MNKFWTSAALVAGMMMSGCGGARQPASGETYISLELSGGHLTETLVFEGTVEKTPYLFDKSTSILAMGVNLKASNADAVLEQFTVSLETGKSGPFDADDGDLDIVFDFPSVPASYSLRPIGGTGGVVLDRGNDDRATITIHFDASPTQMDGRDKVYRLEGVIDSRN